MSFVLSVTTPSLQQQYSNVINIIDGQAPDSTTYLHGYNKKCFIAMNNLKLGISSTFIFDLNYPSPNINHTVPSSGNCALIYMCTAEYYNCSSSIPNCL